MDLQIRLHNRVHYFKFKSLNIFFAYRFVEIYLKLIVIGMHENQ